MLKKKDRAWEKLDRYALLMGLAAAVLLTALLVLVNTSMGPMANLNDIQSWSNRLLLIGYTAVVHFSLLLFLCLGKHRAWEHLLARQLLVTFSLYILLHAMNQKTFAYNTQIQPIVRAMDTGGLRAIPQFYSSLSVPALSLYYLLTRGPIYDMYLAKLFCIGSFELLCMTFLCIAEEKDEAGRYNWRPEAVFALCLILPQGFLSSACAAQIEVAGVMLGMLGYLLLEQGKRNSAVLLYGAGASICTGLWLLLPLCLLRREKWKLTWKDMLKAVLAAMLLVLPGCVAGAGISGFTSLLAVFTRIPQPAAGVPNLVSFFPRASILEMPEYAFLRPLPELDLVTRAAETYTQTHFEILMRGLALANVAVYLGGIRLTFSRKGNSWKCTCLCTMLTAFLCGSSLTVGAWLAVCCLCILCMVYEPGMRLPCGMILFATAGGAAYPVTSEIMIKPVYISVLCLAALGMLLDLWPGKGQYREEKEC